MIIEVRSTIQLFPEQLYHTNHHDRATVFNESRAYIPGTSLALLLSVHRSRRARFGARFSTYAQCHASPVAAVSSQWSTSVFVPPGPRKGKRRPWCQAPVIHVLSKECTGPSWARRMVGRLKNRRHRWCCSAADDRHILL